MPDPDYTGLAVAIGRVEEKVNGINTNREADISFQQSVRDTLIEFERRLTAQETGVKTLKWLFMAVTPIAIFAATWVSQLIIG